MVHLSNVGISSVLVKTVDQSCSRFRRVLPQILATTIKNFHIIDMGFILAMPTVVIPALTGISNDRNRDEFLSITGRQASWLSSIGYLVQPFGALLSGFITDPLGRKLSMILVNIPFAIGWFMLYRSTALWHIYAGFALHGLAIGLVEAPIVSYVGEISEPSIRSFLLGYSNISATLGMFVLYVLNTFMSWRTVASICMTVPLISTLSLYFIPETPQWLLSKNRTKEAAKSLRWLRGWVSNENSTVAQEFYELQRHSERSKSCQSCAKADIRCSHATPTLAEKLTELKRKRNLKPFTILVSLFFLIQMTGTYAMRPFIVQIFKAYESPIALDQAAIIMSYIDNIGQIVFLCLVRFTGKRLLFMAVSSGVFLCSLVLSCYGFIYLPSGFNSFDLQNQSFHLDNPDLAYIPMACLFLWSFFSFSGLVIMPWILISELLPFKSRSLASGIAIAIDYFFGFISKKSYYNLETSLSLPGVTLLFCGITFAGLILSYFILPETEGRSLEDIELHFSDNSKKLTDWNIAKGVPAEQNSRANDTESPEPTFTIEGVDRRCLEGFVWKS